MNLFTCKIIESIHALNIKRKVSTQKLLKNFFINIGNQKKYKTNDSILSNKHTQR